MSAVISLLIGFAIVLILALILYAVVKDFWE